MSDATTETEQQAETEEDTRTFRVLRLDAPDTSNVGRIAWIEQPETMSTPWPTAADIGERYGEGDFMLIEVDDKYSFQSVYSFRVVAEKRYRDAREDES